MDGPEPEERPPQEGRTPGDLYRVSWFFYLVLAIGGILWLGSSAGDGFLGVLVDEDWWLDAGLGVLAGLALTVAWQSLRSFVAPMRRLEETLAEIIGPLDAAQVFALALMSGVAEEIFFRGALQHAWGPVWATLAFAVLHSGPGRAFLAWTAFAAVAGAAFAALTWALGTVVAAATAHVVVNWINLSRLVGAHAEAAGEAGVIR